MTDPDGLITTETLDGSQTIYGYDKLSAVIGTLVASVALPHVTSLRNGGNIISGFYHLLYRDQISGYNQQVSGRHEPLAVAKVV